jgi:hypothetical protein
MQNLAKKSHKGGKSHADMQSLWGGFGAAAGPAFGGLGAYGAGFAGAAAPFAGPAGFGGYGAYGAGYGYDAAPFAGAAGLGYGAYGGFGYGPANAYDASVAYGDDMMAWNAGAASQWDGFMAGQDSLAAQDFATRSDAAWKLGNTDSDAALKARKAQYKAWATADNDAVDASNDYFKASNFYGVATEDDAIARSDIAAAMRATAIQKNAQAVADRAMKAAARYTKGANKAETDEDKNIKDSKTALKAMIKARKAQTQHATDAYNDSLEANTDLWNARTAYGSADVLADDSWMSTNAANAAFGAEYSNAWTANTDAWAGMNAGFAAATPEFYGAGYGMGAPFMW